VKPGVYDLSAEQYHADPVPGGSLSSSGARKILQSPARFRWEQDHRRAPKKAWDIGHAAHKVVLGAGPELVLFPGTGKNPGAWQKDDDIAAVAAMRADGKVPLKPSDWTTVHEMAEAIRRHPLASRLLNPDGGVAEQVLVWVDQDTGVTRRAMLDWRRGRVIVDYKTADSASKPAFSRAVASYGYHQQDPYYRDGVAALGLAADPVFLFIVQEKTPPYLVAVYDLDDVAIQIGHERNRRALEIYRDCTETGLWPGYPSEVKTVALPRYAEYAHEHEDVMA